jgi:hypothetical protein
LRISVFVSVFLVLVTALLVIQGTNLNGDVFARQNPEVLRRISLLPPYDLAAKKIQHAIASPRFDVGVFGSSRVVAVGSAGLDIDGQSFFNFAVPGTSMRQTVNLIEKLEAEGKAPKLSIISFDNLEFGFYGNAEYPHALWRWTRAFGDIFWALTNRTGDMVLLVHFILDHLYTEWRALADTWNFSALWARTAVQFPDLVPSLANIRNQYDPDGSRPYPNDHVPDTKRFERAKERMILLPHYLERDMKRLRALDRAGTKFVIFESHLEPQSRAYLAATPDAVITRQRARFILLCRRYELTCFTATELPLPATTSRWNDCCHAPSDALEQLVSELTRRHAQP